MAPNQPHFLLVAFPAQGHINPALQLAKRLIELGVKVTFTTTISAYRKMIKGGQIPKSINFEVFSEGFDEGYKRKIDDTPMFLSQLRTQGTQSVNDTIILSAKNGTPVTCLVYTILLPWVKEVANGFSLPSTLLWTQPESVLRIYYYYFNGYHKFIGDDGKEPAWSIKIPGLPLLGSRDLPSFCLPSNTYNFALDLFKEELDMVASKERPTVLVNSFDELEEEALKDIDGKLNMVAIGPLIPSTFLDDKDPLDKSFGGDFLETSRDYLHWMDTKPVGSIIYISFGSIIMLSKKQKEAIAHALLESESPFLWVIRDRDGDMIQSAETEDEDEELSCMEQLEKLGLIVPWCSQLEVLSHQSLGCFLTHCGWNSTLESIVCGVPVVAFPHWIEQSTNAKLLESVWEIGVRVTTNEDGVVEGEEIRKCIEMVMGGHENKATMRKNAKKWKDLARDAMKESGSSCMNLKAFVVEVSRSSTLD